MTVPDHGPPHPPQGSDDQDPRRRWIEVSAGLVFRNGRLLITQRTAGTHLAGFWEFPGGKREPDESWEDCLRRELREELGVEVEVGPLFEEVRHEYPVKAVHLRFYRCHLPGGEPSAIGCAALAWVERGGLRSFAFPEADATLLARLESTPEVWEGH